MTADTNKIQEIKAYVMAHIDCDLTARALAARYGLSITTLRRRFLQTEGEPLGAYVRRTRMECAAEDLLFGETAADVCVGCNFNSRSSFNRAFKRTFGVTPQDYKLARGKLPPAAGAGER